MRGLRGTRVVLLDDDPNDAIPIIKAFSKAGIPVAYFSGSKDELPSPSRRLRGVRLAILDMDLGVGGADANIASTLVNTFSQTISEANGPYGILIWTKHPELKGLVTDYIFNRSTLPKPVFVAMLRKSDFVKKPAGAGTPPKFAIQRLSNRLVTVLMESSPLECLQAWEDYCFQAATNATNHVSEHADASATDLQSWSKAWQNETLGLLLSIGKAQAQRQLSADNCMLSIFLALNPLHADRLDLLVEDSNLDFTSHVAKIMAAEGSSKIERRAKVNTMLHLASDQLGCFNAGNIYLFGKAKRPVFLPSLERLLADAVEGNVEKRKASLALLRNEAVLCAIEITPVCDHAQLKLARSKLIVGMVVPVGRTAAIKGRAGFLKAIGPVYIQKQRVLVPGVYSIYLDSRYVIAEKPAKVKVLKPIARIRTQLLADIQGWAAYQSSRQGVMLLA